jgi:hypothetical protein
MFSKMFSLLNEKLADVIHFQVFGNPPARIPQH